MKWYRKVKRHKNTICLTLLLGAAVFLLGAFVLIKVQSQNTAPSGNDGSGEAGVSRLFEVFFGTEEKEKLKQASEQDGSQEEQLNGLVISDNEIYTFLQGPRAWETQVPWSGEWCEIEVEGNPFGGFGCGFCCMANIYSTLSEYECSPSDIYLYSMEATDYVPTGAVGAIDWEQMLDVLKQVGMECELCLKPDTYEEFQHQMEESPTAIVLVSSTDDDSFWTDTAGHYVNIWQYDASDDTVMVAEPGSPENNRTRIPLRYVYDALKTISSYQYLKVDGYLAEANNWKWDGIDDNWVSPW